ncbi:hypothetical protein D3C83_02730 [compost metagenome]
MKRRLAFGGWIIRRRQLDVGSQDVLGPESRIHGLQVEDRADHQPRRKEDDNGQRDLGGDESRLRTAPARARSAGAVVERRSQIQSRCLTQRHETEHDAGDHDRGKGHAHQPQVERRGDRAAQGAGDQHLEQIECLCRDQQSERGGAARQQQPLDEQLAQQLDAAAAERCPYGELAVAFRAACDQQPGHVRARNEEDQHRCCEQKQE